MLAWFFSRWFIWFCKLHAYIGNWWSNVSLFDADIKIRVLTKESLVLECANKSTSDKVQWQKEKKPLNTALAGNEEFISIDNETGNLHILQEKDVFYGNYTCKTANSTIEYRVVRKYFSIFYTDLNKLLLEKYLSKKKQKSVCKDITSKPLFFITRFL